MAVSCYRYSVIFIAGNTTAFTLTSLSVMRYHIIPYMNTYVRVESAASTNTASYSRRSHFAIKRREDFRYRIIKLRGLFLVFV
jgi:hypothetical protein